MRGSSEINLHRERVGILEKRLGVGKGKDDLVLKSKLRYKWIKLNLFLFYSSITNINILSWCHV